MAGVKISNLSSAGTLTGDELFAIVQDSTTLNVLLSTLLTKFRDYVDPDIDAGIKIILATINSDWIYLGRAYTSDDTPTATENYTYVVAEAGTVFGLTCSIGDVLVGDGSSWNIASIGVKLNKDKAYAAFAAYLKMYDSDLIFQDVISSSDTISSPAENYAYLPLEAATYALTRYQKFRYYFGAATAAGDITLTFDSDSYAITVAIGTAVEVAALAAAESYTGMVVKYTSGNNYVDFWKTTSDNLTTNTFVDTGSTGVTATLEAIQSYLATIPVGSSELNSAFFVYDGYSYSKKSIEQKYFDGEISSTSDLDAIKEQGIYRRKNAAGNTQYIVFVEVINSLIKQTRIYTIRDSTKTNRFRQEYRYSEDYGQNWSEWENTFAVFSGSVYTSDPEADNYIDKIITTGIYRRAESDEIEGLAPYILFVYVSNSTIYQSRIYNTTTFKIDRRKSTDSGSTWSSWRGGIYQFSGYVVTTDSNADNYIDNIQSTGVYLRDTSIDTGGVGFIMYVNSDGTRQTRIYGDSSNNSGFNIEYRDYSNSAWGSWITSNLISTQLTGTYSEVNTDNDYYDNITVEGTYINKTTSEIMYVRNVAYYGQANVKTIRQLIFTLDVNNTPTTPFSIKSRLYNNGTSQWENWIITNGNNTEFISKALDTDKLLEVTSNYTFIDDEYVRFQTKIATSLTTENAKRSEAIALADFSGIPCVGCYTRGASVQHVAFYSSDTISLGNYVGMADLTSTSSANYYDDVDRYIENFPLLSIPDTATHFVVSQLDSDEYDIRIFDLVPSVAEFNDNLQKVSNLYSSAFSNPYNLEAEILLKRGNWLQNFDSDKVQPLLIIAGQSNADGRATGAPTDVFTSGKVSDNYQIWDRENKEFGTYQLSVLTGASDNDSPKFAMDPFFAKEFTDAYPDKTLYAIRCTYGGTPISELGSTTSPYRWQPKTELISEGEGSLCDEFRTRLTEAYAWAAKKGILLIPIMLMYHQGESDADIGTNAINAYQQNLSNLFSWFRGVLNAPTLPVINGEINYTFNAQYPEINTIFSTMNGLDERFKTVDMSSNQTDIGDGLHYDADALRYMGETMYDLFEEYYNFIVV